MQTYLQGKRQRNTHAAWRKTTKLCTLLLSPWTVSVCVSRGLKSPGITSTHTHTPAEMRVSDVIQDNMLIVCVCTDWVGCLMSNAGCTLLHTGPGYSWSLASFCCFLKLIFQKCCNVKCHTLTLTVACYLNSLKSITYYYFPQVQQSSLNTEVKMELLCL